MFNSNFSFTSATGATCRTLTSSMCVCFLNSYYKYRGSMLIHYLMKYRFFDCFCEQGFCGWTLRLAWKHKFSVFSVMDMRVWPDASLWPHTLCPSAAVPVSASDEVSAPRPLPLFFSPNFFSLLPPSSCHCSSACPAPRFRADTELPYLAIVLWTYR